VARGGVAAGGSVESVAERSGCESLPKSYPRITVKKKIKYIKLASVKRVPKWKGRPAPKRGTSEGRKMKRKVLGKLIINAGRNCISVRKKKIGQ